MKDAFPKPEKKHRRSVAVDETKLKLCGEQFYVWAAIDVKSKEVLACHVSWTRSIMHAESLLQVLETCTNKPLILVDRGPWYPEAPRSLGLKWKHVTFGMRNRIERWFGILKSAKSFLEAFITLYNTLTKTKTWQHLLYICDQPLKSSL